MSAHMNSSASTTLAGGRRAQLEAADLGPAVAALRGLTEAADTLRRQVEGIETLLAREGR